MKNNSKPIIIALSNHKGGVGKTTSAINLAAALNILKKRILLIDLDPQANLSQSLGIREPVTTIYGAIRGEYDLQPVQVLKGLDVIPSTLNLSGAEVELSTKIGREFVLKNLIEKVNTQYDYIIIDSPPSLGLLTVNAFTAADVVLIPLQAQFLAIQGLSALVEIIQLIQANLNKNLKLGGVFITQYDSRKVLNRNVSDTITQHFKSELFKTKIRDNIALAEAPTAGLDIFRYNQKSYGAADYMELAKEVIKRI